MAEDHITKKENQTPLSIEQAGNFLAEKKETLEVDAKTEARKAPITVAPVQDREKYLSYCISLLENISERDKNLWCKIANKPPAMYTTMEVADMLKKVLTLRIMGRYTYEHIAKYLHCQPKVVEQTEDLAVAVVRKAIEDRKLVGVPLIGGISGGMN